MDRWIICNLLLIVMTSNPFCLFVSIPYKEEETQQRTDWAMSSASCLTAQRQHIKISTAVVTCQGVTHFSSAAPTTSGRFQHHRPQCSRTMIKLHHLGLFTATDAVPAWSLLKRIINFFLGWGGWDAAACEIQPRLVSCRRFVNFCFLPVVQMSTPANSSLRFFVCTEHQKGFNLYLSPWQLSRCHAGVSSEAIRDPESAGFRGFDADRDQSGTKRHERK